MKHMAKMPFAKDDHMVKTVPPDRANQPLHVSVLKGSQLHLIDTMGRRLSESPMYSIPCTGTSSRCWTGAAPGERTAFISRMRRAD
jgi:hypothetical protein